MADTERTRVFISWSGDRSLKVANSLQAWLKMVVQPIDVWFSDVNITPGLRWRHALGDELQKSQFAIVCLTRENMNAPWLLFEAGAIGRSLDESRVVPLLLDLSQSDVKGPLAEFQALPLDQIGIWRLVRWNFTQFRTRALTLHSRSGYSMLFGRCWKPISKWLVILTQPMTPWTARPVPPRLRWPRSSTRCAVSALRPMRMSVLTALDGLFIQAQGELHYLTDQAQQSFAGRRFGDGGCTPLRGGTHHANQICNGCDARADSAVE